jgi:hypothetical protein
MAVLAKVLSWCLAAILTGETVRDELQRSATGVIGVASGKHRTGALD